MPKRRERVAPPPATGGWGFRFASNDAVKGWEQICSAAPANARRAWNRITNDPRTAMAVSIRSGAHSGPEL